MKKTNSITKNIVLAAVLTALGIAIPMIMPVRINAGASTYTLASHVPLFIAMFISPLMAFIVGIGTTIGFILSYPLVVWLRAASHIIWAVAGAWLIQRNPRILSNSFQTATLAAIIAVIHAVLETIIILLITNSVKSAGVLLGIWGLGFVIHSLIDFALAYIVFKSLKRSRLV
ncbi:MAG: hypothetical protein Q8865_08310 [Bacillota bacterium]|nr:hypothetical protein [Bacillota bacterium]